MENFATFIKENRNFREEDEIIAINGEKMKEKQTTGRSSLEFKKTKFKNITEDDFFFPVEFEPIIKYYKNIKGVIEKYTKNYGKNNEKSEIDSKIKQDIDLFLVGNKIKGIKGKYSEILKLNIFNIYAEIGTGIVKGMPIVEYKNHKFSSIFFFKELKDGRLIGLKGNKPYKIDGIISNAINYKLDHNKFKKSYNKTNKIIKETKKVTIENLKKTIELVSISEDPSSIYYMVQLLSKFK